MRAANLRLIAIALLAGIVLGLIAWAAATCGSAKAPSEEGAVGSTTPDRGVPQEPVGAATPVAGHSVAHPDLPQYTSQQRPTPTAIPGFSYPGRLSRGGEVEVWVYSDTADRPTDCSRLVSAMVPLPSDVPAKAVTCSLDDPSFFRVHFLRDGAGVLHLQSVEVLLFGTARLLTPTPPLGVPTCDEIRGDLLPASADPVTRESITVCNAVPPARGQSVSRFAVWGAMLPAVPPETFPADVRCWELIPYQGAAGDSAGVPYPLRCILG